MSLAGKRILVTGGASFIGSHLVEALLKKEDVKSVRVVDNFSSGKIGNLGSLNCQILPGNLLLPEMVDRSLNDIDIVFHLAADHGGRGYVDLEPVACASNLALDSLVLQACLDRQVEKVIYASSGCIYPMQIQQDTSMELYLTEDMAGPPYNADNLYGWAKLMGEMTLKSMYETRGLSSVSCRYFTVYGPRAKEDHAVMAMIARTFIRQDPFQIWGDGSQIRNWTHVSDIVEGTILAAKEIHDGSAVNLGTEERTTVLEAAEMLCRYTEYSPAFEFQPNMPVGPLNRVASGAYARDRLGWNPVIDFGTGVLDTYEWYADAHDRMEVMAGLPSRLLAR